MQRVMVGNVEVVALVDMVGAYPADSVYTEAGSALDGYQDLLDGSGNVVLSFSSFLLRADGRTVLVDAGNGPEAEGKLMEELRAAGVAPGDIDTVVFTHLHGDHTGWNLLRETGGPRFPSARYLVPRGDWEHYGAQNPPPDSFTRDVAPLEGLGALQLIEGEHTISPSLVTLHTPGHTPGHLTVVISSEGEEAYVLGDAFLTPVDVAEPDWVTSWDWAAEPVRATRRMLLERIGASNGLVAASHLPEPGLGRFVMTERRRTFEVVRPDGA
ncbi:MAG: MBL fold metallo-hydrolase [Dehalococcoidia bacterium]|nr:MBL fold metallo-hydrolase [Dehalococcoidia bacterium]